MQENRSGICFYARAAARYLRGCFAFSYCCSEFIKINSSMMSFSKWHDEIHSSSYLSSLICMENTILYVRASHFEINQTSNSSTLTAPFSFQPNTSTNLLPYMPFPTYVRKSTSLYLYSDRCFLLSLEKNCSIMISTALWFCLLGTGIFKVTLSYCIILILSCQ